MPAYRTAKRFVTGFIFSLTLSLPITHAQNQTTPSASPTTSSIPPTPSPISLAPSAFVGIASATGNGTIYYHGGLLNAPTIQYSNELFSLDVTKPWPINNPAWTNLTNMTTGMGPRVGGHSSTMSKDLTKFFVTAPEGVLDAPFFYQYDVNSKTWTAEKAPLAQASIWSNRKEAYMLTDTTSGDIWYIGGSVNGVEINEIDKYISGSWNANIAVTNPDSGLGEGTGAVATFAKVSSGTAHLINGKIYMFGGFTSMGGSKTYLNFQNLPWIDTTTRTPTIGTQLTLGTVPPPRQNHCSVLTESKKVIIYGGYDPNTRTTFQDIWSLDLINLTWQLIVPVNVSTPRYGHTCNIVGANMIVLAGRASGKEGNKDIAYGTDIQVYDVMESMWMRSYSYKKDTTPITTLVPPSGGSSKSSGGLGAGAIAGIVIGVLLVAGCAAGFVFYRKRQRRIKTQEAELEKEAYLASLAPEKVANGRNGSRTNERRRRQKSQRNTQYPDSVVIPRSGSTRRLNGSGMATGSPGASHYGFSGVESQSGREDENYSLTTSEAPGNVQYLMQQLPDGSIAVQPVYFNHQPFQLQHSPNMAYSETSSLGGIIRTPLAPSPTLTARTRDANGGGVGEFVAPPLPPSVHSPRDSSASEITSLGYADPHSGNNLNQQIDRNGSSNSHSISVPPQTHLFASTPSVSPFGQSPASSSPPSPVSQRYSRNFLRGN